MLMGQPMTYWLKCILHEVLNGLTNTQGKDFGIVKKSLNGLKIMQVPILKTITNLAKAVNSVLLNFLMTYAKQWRFNMANKKKYYTYQHSMENRVKNAFDMAGKQIVKNSIGSYITAFFLTILAIGLFAVIMGFPTMWLWNWIMPVLCGFGKLTFWRALGLNFLCGILFKNVNNSKS